MKSVKKNDKVIILVGKDKGRQGTVLEVLPKDGKVMVQGANFVTRHAKARKQGDTSGIIKREAYISVSNVMPICSSCKKPCRISIIVDNGKRMRACNRCKEAF